MSPPQFRKIKNGVLYLSLVDPLAVGYSPDWQTPDGTTDLGALTEAIYTDGWCGPGTTTTNVKESSFALNLEWVQDEFLEGGGLVGFAYDQDAQECYFLVAGDTAAGAARLAGRCWIIAGQVFGPANTINTTSAVWNCDKKPLAEWPAPVVPLAATAARSASVTADA